MPHQVPCHYWILSAFPHWLINFMRYSCYVCGKFLFQFYYLFLNYIFLMMLLYSSWFFSLCPPVRNHVEILTLKGNGISRRGLWEAPPLSMDYSSYERAPTRLLPLWQSEDPRGSPHPSVPKPWSWTSSLQDWEMKSCYLQATQSVVFCYRSFHSLKQ